MNDLYERQIPFLFNLVTRNITAAFAFDCNTISQEIVKEKSSTRES